MIAYSSGPASWDQWILWVAVMATLAWAVGDPLGLLRFIWNWLLRPIILLFVIAIEWVVESGAEASRDLVVGTSRDMIRRQEMERAQAVNRRIQTSAQEAIEEMRQHAESLERRRRS